MKDLKFIKIDVENFACADQDYSSNYSKRNCSPPSRELSAEMHIELEHIMHHIFSVFLNIRLKPNALIGYLL